MTTMLKAFQHLGQKKTPRRFKNDKERQRLQKVVVSIRIPRHLVKAIDSVVSDLDVNRSLLIEWVLQDFVNTFDVDPEFRTPLFELTLPKRLDLVTKRWFELGKSLNPKRSKSLKLELTYPKGESE